jgi:hypothetical protein
MQDKLGVTSYPPGTKATAKEAIGEAWDAPGRFASRATHVPRAPAGLIHSDASPGFGAAPVSKTLPSRESGA